MNSQTASIARTTATQQRCLLAIGFIVLLFAATRSEAQGLQAGISVNLPLVTNATAVPDADKEDALIVTVTVDGDIYLGVDPIKSDALADKIKHAIAFNPQKGVYIKADARASYADVEKVLSAFGKGGVKKPVLLTTQRESVQPGTLVPPKGFEVLNGPQLRSKSHSTLVQLLSSGQQSPSLMINHEPVSWTDLPIVLGRLLPAQTSKIVQIKADGVSPFSDVARVIDISRSVGATVALDVSGL